MRSVLRGSRRTGLLLALLTIFIAQGAAAKGQGDGPGWRQQFERAKRLIVTMLGRFSPPPGEPTDGATATLGRFSIPGEE